MVLKETVFLVLFSAAMIHCSTFEPKCYSRFDWEEKLLEKAIRTEIKVQQYMDKLDLALDEIRGHKEEYQEWKQRFDSKARQLDASVEEWKQSVDSKANQLEASVERQLMAFAHNLTAVQDDTIQMLETVYTRWGRTTCPGNDSEPIYGGFAGGSKYTHSGAAASMLCLPTDPDWDSGRYSDKLDPVTGYIFGTEYQDGQSRSDQLFGRSHYEHDVPCVVCNVRKRSSTIMIAGKSKCYAGWTFEYSGYLMSGHHGHVAASDYYCIDKDAEDLRGGGDDHNGYLLYFVESRCGSLKCPPYVEGREMQCVVCTK